MSDPNQMVEDAKAEAQRSLRRSRVSMVVAVIAVIAAIVTFFLNYFYIESIRTKLAEQGVSIEQAKNEIAKAAQLAARFGSDTNWARAGRGEECTLGEIILTAGGTANGVPANGQVLAISTNSALFSLLGNKYGGDGKTTFALPDLRGLAPNGLTYSICVNGIYPYRDY
jgi:type II secretory pathway pseudopilin PulG